MTYELACPWCKGFFYTGFDFGECPYCGNRYEAVDDMIEWGSDKGDFPDDDYKKD